MSTIDFTRPFPDYVVCPNCGELEVEVWCYESIARCHACGHEFTHPVPRECEDVCTDEMRARARELSQRPAQGNCLSARAGGDSNVPAMSND